MAGKATLLRRKRPNPHHPFKSQRAFVPLSRRKEDRSIKKTNKPRQLRNWRGLMKKNPGGDLLLRDLSSDYHWRGSVSLPGSERDRVGPLRSGHRASGGRGLFFSSSCLPGSPWGALRGIF